MLHMNKKQDNMTLSEIIVSSGAKSLDTLKKNQMEVTKIIILNILNTVCNHCFRYFN